MWLCWKPIVAGLAVATLPALAGCSRGGEEKQAAQAANAAAESDASRAGAPAAAVPAGQPVADPLHPVVLMETSLGNIKVQLDAEKAPLTVDNFLAYVNSKHYDQTIFHQVLNDYPKVVIGGAFTPKLVEKPPHTAILNEADNGLKNVRGTIAMLRQDNAIHSATCYFFFNVGDNEVLDHKDRTLQGYGYCVFGKVIEGMDVVDKIAQTPLHELQGFEQIPVDTVVIKSVSRVQ